MNQLFCQNKNNPENTVSYEISRSSEEILVDFKITNYTQKNLNSQFSQLHPKFNWGLWQYDVVEFFIQTDDHHYYEFQCSPLNQKFQLGIIKPREIYFTPLKCYIKTSVTEIYDILNIQISVTNRLIRNESFKFGCFACLGKEQALYTHHETKLDIIDFHRPDLFFQEKSFY